MVLEKTLESLLDSKEIKTVIPKRKCEVKVKFAQLCLTLALLPAMSARLLGLI